MDPIKSICNGCVGERNRALLHSESESDDSISPLRPDMFFVGADFALGDDASDGGFNREPGHRCLFK
jgi:hypothetical protein